MRCEEIVMREPECVRPDDPARLAAEKMREANVGFLPVCDLQNVVVGVVTDRDLATRLVADARPATTFVSDVMTSEGLVTCRPDDDLAEAARLMREHAVGRVVLTDDADHLMGVVSLADLVRYLEEPDSVDVMRDVTDREVPQGAPQ